VRGSVDELAVPHFAEIDAIREHALERGRRRALICGARLASHIDAALQR